MTMIMNLLFGTGGLLRVRGLLALGTTATVLSMFAQEIEIPPELLAAWTGIIGVYFGSRIAAPAPTPTDDQRKAESTVSSAPPAAQAPAAPTAPVPGAAPDPKVGS